MALHDTVQPVGFPLAFEVSSSGNGPKGPLCRPCLPFPDCPRVGRAS